MGADLFMTKPYEMNVLVAKIRQKLAGGAKKAA